ncbi:MAG: hypothetical protein IKA16_02275 [Oscillospiraceae bacterium]|nr:hypothetical protein [Oscillospiraceae bacterium]
MAIMPFLAMTASEMRSFSQIPAKTAWMACHFSPYGLGLSNLPRVLPSGSLLMVDDITPPHGHDSQIIAEQLQQCVETLGCCGILLDFQRPDNEETATLAQFLTAALPCPVAVSEEYAEAVDGPVFLSPVPPSVALSGHLAPWAGRDIWLDLSLAAEVITVTAQGAQAVPLPFPDMDADGFAETALHCHYRTELRENAAVFTLWRTREDLETLLEEAEESGIRTAVGLYQELSIL